MNYISTKMMTSKLPLIRSHFHGWYAQNHKALNCTKESRERNEGTVVMRHPNAKLSALDPPSKPKQH